MTIDYNGGLLWIMLKLIQMEWRLISQVTSTSDYGRAVLLSIIKGIPTAENQVFCLACGRRTIYLGTGKGLRVEA